MVNQAIKDFAGKVDIIPLDVDNQANVNLANKYRVDGIPTYIFLDSKGNMVDQAVGALAQNTLYTKLQAIVGR